MIIPAGHIVEFRIVDVSGRIVFKTVIFVVLLCVTELCP